MQAGGVNIHRLIVINGIDTDNPVPGSLWLFRGNTDFLANQLI